MNTDTEEFVELKITTPNMYDCIIHNDETTSFDFVIMVLGKVFDKSFDESLRIAMEAHQSKSSVCGTYSKEMADTKKNEATLMARQSGFALVITCEEQQK